jgi:hypothetical protein
MHYGGRSDPGAVVRGLLLQPLDRAGIAAPDL